MDSVSRQLLAGGFAGDPFFSSVTLLLKADGTNGATSFTDSSRYGNNYTGFSGTVISTTQSRFGGSSMYIDGSSYADASPSASLGWGSGDFTFEFWIYPTQSPNTTKCFFDGRSYPNAPDGVDIRENGVNAFYQSTRYAIPSSYPTLNAWNHVAHVRNGTTYTVYLNGSSVCSFSLPANFNSNVLRIGGYVDSATNWSPTCYLDEIRLTKGVARYTANFTPPTEPFPTF